MRIFTISFALFGVLASLASAQEEALQFVGANDSADVAAEIVQPPVPEPIEAQQAQPHVAAPTIDTGYAAESQCYSTADSCAGACGTGCGASGSCGKGCGNGLCSEGYCVPHTPPNLPYSTLRQYFKSNACNSRVWDGYRNSCTFSSKNSAGQCSSKQRQGCGAKGMNCGKVYPASSVPCDGPKHLLPTAWKTAPCDTPSCDEVSSCTAPSCVAESCDAPGCDS